MKDIVYFCVIIVTVLTTQVSQAANRYFVPAQSVPAGASGQQLEVRCDNDVALSAYSFGIDYDESVLAVTDLSTVGTAAESAFVLELIDPVAGTVGCAAVLTLDPDNTFVPGGNVPAGQNQVIAFLSVNVLPATDTVTTIDFAEVNLNPAIPGVRVNVMTDEDGSAIIPSLESGVITVEDRTPVIQSLANNSGFAGAVFQVVGDFFEEPGLQVTVCGSPASAVLLSDGVTLDVTAPICGTVGFEEVQVCTDRGCDSEPNGFDYQQPVMPPTIDQVVGGNGQEGIEFEIVGTNFEFANLAVSVCGQAAGIVSVSGDGLSIIASAPNCDALGPADVQVCTEFGCALAAGAFDYLFAGPRYARGDCNGDSVPNAIVDTVYMLNFLFGGTQAWPCYAACDFNDDLAFDVSDAVFFLNSAFSGGDPLPPPLTCAPGSEGGFVFGCVNEQCGS